MTDTTPKPLLPVGGVPMVERLARQLRSADIAYLSVITGWLGDRVEAHLRSLADLDVELEFFREVDRRGTVGAVSALGVHEGTTLFLFADLVTDFDFGQFRRFHVDRGAALTLATHQERYSIQLGEVISDGDRVVGYLEKPEKEFTICSGIALMEAEVIPLIGNSAGLFGMPDLVDRVLSEGLEVAHWPHTFFWVDVNSPAALASVERTLAMTGELVVG